MNSKAAEFRQEPPKLSAVGNVVLEAIGRCREYEQEHSGRRRTPEEQRHVSDTIFRILTRLMTVELADRERWVAWSDTERPEGWDTIVAILAALGYVELCTDAEVPLSTVRAGQYLVKRMTEAKVTADDLKRYGHGHGSGSDTVEASATVRPLQWDRRPASDRTRELVVRFQHRERDVLDQAQSWFRRSTARDEVSDAMTAILCDVAYQALLAPEVWVTVDQSNDIVPYVVQNLAGCFEARYENAGRDDPLVWLRADNELLASINQLGLTKDDFSPNDKPSYEVMRVDRKDREEPSGADRPPASVGQFRVAGDRITSGTIEEIEAAYDSRQNAVSLNMRFMLSDMFNKSIDELVEDIYGKTGERKTSDSVEQTRLALRLILGNLLRAYQIDPKRYVILPLRDEHYRNGLNNPVGIYSRAIRRVKDYLTDGSQPLACWRKGYLDRATGQSQSSRIRATDRLKEVVEQGLKDEEGLTHRLTVDTSIDPNIPSLAGLFDVVDRPVIELRAEKQKGEKKGKVIEDWKVTPETDGMRDRLERYNAFIATQWIDLLLPDDEYRKAILPQSGRDGHVDFIFGRKLHRVFNNGAFEQGGRFYGGWWIQIEGDYRKSITINWAPTVELDYSAMMVAMLYAKKGLTLQGDGYAIDGIDGTYRDLIKDTVIKLINAKGRMRAPMKSELPPGWTWKQLQEAVKARHAPIADYFGSGVGLELQRIDSDIAEDVMMHFVDRDILVLPVHDSFLIDARHEAALREKMIEACMKNIGEEIGIKADPSFIETVLFKNHALLEEAVEKDRLGVSSIRDFLDDYEGQPEFGLYRARKRDFLSRQTEAWRWAYYSS